MQAEDTLAKQTEQWRAERAQSKEDYKKEVDKVRERLWENRTLESMVKQTEQRANAAEAENKRLTEELKALKHKRRLG